MQNRIPNEPEQPLAVSPALQQKQAEVHQNIRRIRARANRSMFSLALFVAISIGAIRGFDFLPSFTPHFKTILGRPPSSNVVSAALMLYSFSAIILILSRMMSGAAANSGMAHVGYLSGFFFFYHFAGGMEANFWAVFAAGVTIIGLEIYHSWTRSNEEIRQEEETLSELERRINRDGGT